MMKQTYARACPIAIVDEAATIPCELCAAASQRGDAMVAEHGGHDKDGDFCLSESVFRALFYRACSTEAMELPERSGMMA